MSGNYEWLNVGLVDVLRSGLVRPVAYNDGGGAFGFKGGGLI